MRKSEPLGDRKPIRQLIPQNGRIAQW